MIPRLPMGGWLMISLFTLPLAFEAHGGEPRPTFKSRRDPIFAKLSRLDVRIPAGWAQDPSAPKGIDAAWVETRASRPSRLTLSVVTEPRGLPTRANMARALGTSENSLSPGTNGGWVRTRPGQRTEIRQMALPGPGNRILIITVSALSERIDTVWAAWTQAITRARAPSKKR